MAHMHLNQPEDTPTTNTPEAGDWLDQIMEDLTVGHNFDYAAEAIREHVAEADYEHRVAENCRVTADMEIPGVWLNPVSGKKLYNEAHLAELERALYTEVEALLHDEDEEVMMHNGYTLDQIDTRTQLRAELRQEFEELKERKTT